MSTTDVVTWAYAAVPVVSAAGWVPQVTRLIRHPRLGEGMSVPTWGLWTLSGSVSLAYVLVVAGDPLLAATFTVNVLGQGIVLAYAIAARLRRPRVPPDGPS